MSDPHGLIDVENFGDGTKRHMATMTLSNPTTGAESSSTSTVYIGEFSQASSPIFDMKCFPFDRKQTIFRITLQILGQKKSRGWFENHPSGCSKKGVLCYSFIYKSKNVCIYIYIFALLSLNKL